MMFGPLAIRILLLHNHYIPFACLQMMLTTEMCILLLVDQQMEALLSGILQKLLDVLCN